MINKVTIKNFRNIDFAEYDLQKLNIFAGPNAQGKTNTILAIYWALNDYLMDGTSDYPSFKPHLESDAEVSVQIVFDTFKFTKTYQENWVKTRGSSEKTMQGHTTEYFIDDVKYAIGEGKKLLLEKLGLNDVKTKTKIDITRAITDPYYLAQTVAWKDLRAFIIELVGDVSDELVLSSKEQFTIIKADMEARKNDVTALNKFYKQQISNSKKEIESNETKGLAFKDYKDVESRDLESAKSAIETINNQIENTRIQAKTAVNPAIAELEKKLNGTQLELMQSITKDRELLEGLNKETQESIKQKEQDYADKSKELEQLDNARYEVKKTQHNNEMLIADISNQIKRKQQEQADLRLKWKEVNASEYQSMLTQIEELTCSNCRHVLNQEMIDAQKFQDEENRDKFNTRKKEQLDNIAVKGKELSSEIENLNFKLNDIPSSEVKEDDTYYNLVKNQKDAAKTSLELLRSKLQFHYESDDSKKLKINVDEIKKDLETEKSKKIENNVDEVVNQLRLSKQPHEQVIAVHNTFLEAQMKIKEYAELNRTLNKDLVLNESKLMALEEFIRTKLSLLKQNVSTVFGELEFVLVESNIKEGSYNEVCYPLILGKNTAFTSGSGAEKIITGVYIIEAVKRALKLQDLPIIFDEADKLDTQTLATRLTTDSQIISTKVDDVNYDRVTLIAK